MSKYSHQELGQFLEQAKAGDREAFNMLYRATAQYQYYRILSFVDNVEEAKDILQEVYCSLYLNLENISQPEFIVKYLSSTAYRICCKYRRKHRAIPMEIDDDLILKTMDSELVNTTAETFEKNEERYQIYNGLKRLDDRQRQAIVLKYLDRKKNEEIAEAMNISQSTVKRIVQSGLVKMKRYIQLPGFIMGTGYFRHLMKTEAIGGIKKLPGPHKPKHVKYVPALTAIVCISALAAGKTVKPKMQLVVQESDLHSQEVKADIYIRSVIPVREVEINGENIHQTVSVKNGVAAVTLTQNGTYRATAKCRNGQSVQQSFQVDSFDETPPKLTSSHAEEEMLTICFSDEQSGVEDARVKDLNGTWHSAFKSDPEQGIFYFQVPDGDYEIVVWDRAGNQLNGTVRAWTAE